MHSLQGELPAQGSFGTQDAGGAFSTLARVSKIAWAALTSSIMGPHGFL